MSRTTERLVLRPFIEGDLEPWAAMNADPEVMEYLGAPLTREKSDWIAEAVNKRYAADGTGFLAIERQSDGAFLGACGLQRPGSQDEPWYPDDMELGWRLAREYWGFGYATEAASSWLSFAFTDLKLKRVISITDAPNERSIAVMLRLGMTFDHTAELVDDGIPFEAVIYSINAPA